MVHVLHVNITDEGCRLAYATELAAKFNRDVLVRYGYVVVRETTTKVPDRSLKESDLAAKISNLIQQKFNTQVYNHKGKMS